MAAGNVLIILMAMSVICLRIVATQDITISEEIDLETLENISELMIQTENTAGNGRGVIGDIEKLKKIAEILQTVGQAVIPAIIESTVNGDKGSSNGGDSQKRPGKGLFLVHSAIAHNGNDDEANPLKDT